MTKMIESRPPFRSLPGKLKTILTCVAFLMTLPLPAVFAGTDAKDMKAITPPPCGSEKDWSVELSSGIAWSNVRSGQPNQPYTIVPVNFTASLKLDDVGLDHYLGGWVRGYSEFYFRGDYLALVRGPEHRYAGIMVGPRYNFVQPGWKLVPYVEGGVGVGFVEANPAAQGFGQDFNFTFDAAVGAKYNFCDDFYMRLGVEYQHISNGGLSEPQFENHPIDSLGPKLSFGYSF